RRTGRLPASSSADHDRFAGDRGAGAEGGPRSSIPYRPRRFGPRGGCDHDSAAHCRGDPRQGGRGTGLARAAGYRPGSNTSGRSHRGYDRLSQHTEFRLPMHPGGHPIPPLQLHPVVHPVRPGRRRAPRGREGMNPAPIRQARFLPSLSPSPAPGPQAGLRPGSNPFERILGEALGGRSGAARIFQPRAGPAQSWTYVRHKSAAVPAQGWKLHVSATSWSAEAVLERALAVLLGTRSSFKFASSPQVLHRLNRGELGRSQVGKFITVYPLSEAQMVRLAARLHEATVGLRGPDVPTDRAFETGSLVSYRYGDFLGQALRRETGLTVPAIAGPLGELVPDDRSTFYRQPEWVRDPFGRPPPTGEPAGPG